MPPKQSRRTKKEENEDIFDYLLSFPQSVLDPGTISERKDVTVDTIKKHASFPWNYRTLSSNSSISVHDIIANATMPWDWSEVSKRLGTTEALIVANPNLPWDTDTLFHRSILSKRIVLATLLDANGQLRWDDRLLMGKGVLSVDDILERPQVPWQWNNPKLAAEMPLEFIAANPHLPWNGIRISSRFDLRFALDNTRSQVPLPWQWDIITKEAIGKGEWDDVLSPDAAMYIDWDIASERVPGDLLGKHPTIPSWNWKILTRRFVKGKGAIFVLSHPDMPWDEAEMPPGIFNPKLLERYPNAPWDWDRFSSHRGLTQKILLDHIEKPWNWKELSKNPRITPSFKRRHPSLPWVDVPMPSLADKIREKEEDGEEDKDGDRTVIEGGERVYRHPDFLNERRIRARDAGAILSGSKSTWREREAAAYVAPFEVLEQHVGASRGPSLWNAVSRRNDVTPEIVARYPNWPWNVEIISQRSFSAQRGKLRKQKEAVKKISDWYLDVTRYNRRYKRAREWLLREAEGILL